MDIKEFTAFVQQLGFSDDQAEGIRGTAQKIFRGVTAARSCKSSASIVANELALPDFLKCVRLVAKEAQTSVADVC
jgi:hypothetical protein